MVIASLVALSLFAQVPTSPVTQGPGYGQGGAWTVVIVDGGTGGSFPSTMTIQGWVVIDAGSQPVPVTGTFYQATQPVSGTVTASQATGSNLHVVVDTAPTTAVTGTFYQATQPVSIATMPSTPVTGTFYQATQPVSIASMPSTPVTGTFWQATQPVSGSLSVSNFPATQPVSGTFYQTVQPTQDVDAGVSLAQIATNQTSGVARTQVTNLPRAPLTGALLTQSPLPPNAAQETGGVLSSILAATTAATSVLTNGTQTVVITSTPMLPPLNPFLYRCNAVRRTLCQP